MRAGMCLCMASLCLAARSKDLTVTIPDQGVVAGREMAVTRSQKAVVYLGLPYAMPLTKPTRFTPPQTQPLPQWADVRNASRFAAACPQHLQQLTKLHRVFAEALPDQISQLTFDEDCLYLNIFIPDGNAPADGWPVMVWFHPGDFTTGATALWDGSILAVKQKVLIVTVAYRLNILGFLTLSNGLSPGNYGLLDQVAALDWVQNKISAFGGSSKNVCLFGYGAGGISVGLHLLSPLSADKFVRAIAMSGNALIPGAIKTSKMQEEYLVRLSKTFSCDSFRGWLVLECLRKVDAMALATEATELGSWGPVVDYELYNATNVSQAFLMKAPADLLTEDHAIKVDSMVGYTDMEDVFEYLDDDTDLEKSLTFEHFKTILTDMISDEFPDSSGNDSCIINMQHIFESVIFYYSPQPQTTDLAALRDQLMNFRTEKKYGSSVYKQAVYTSKTSKTFLYRFDYKPKKSIVEVPEWVKVPHQFDIPFIWGMPYWPSLSKFLWNNADRKFADNIMMMWANFAKYSNPIQSGFNIKWEPFTETVPGFMILDRSFNMSDPMNIDYKSFAFWNIYYPQVVEASTHCCNMTANGVQIKSEYIITGILALIAGLIYLKTS